MRQPHHPTPDPVKPGQESVWDYPRPAITEPTPRRIEIVHRNVALVDSRAAWRTLETSHPPTYYIPQSDVAMEHLHPNPHRSMCEWKGQARYYDIVIGNTRIDAGAWSYSNPSPSFAGIKDAIAFYPDPLDECRVDGAKITPQPGQFYGGWISEFETGPFKGGPGSRFW
ncbi:MAG: DUF427 domain-containing protein [Erythrobacter sp.]